MKFSPSLHALGHRWISTFPGLHKAVASHQGQGFIPWAMPHTFPLTNPCNTLFSLLALTSKPLFSKQPFKDINLPLLQTTHWMSTSILPYIDLLSNPVIFHSLHMAEPSKNTFINLFIHNLCHSAQLIIKPRKGDKREERQEEEG